MRNCSTFESFRAHVQINKPLVNDEDIAIIMFGYFGVLPNASLRDVQVDLGLSVHRVLQRSKWKPCWYTLVHHLSKNGMFNRHNSHFWSFQNLNLIHKWCFQQSYVFYAIKYDLLLTILVTGIWIYCEMDLLLH